MTISHVLVRKLEANKRHLDAATKEREELILQATKEGATVRDIAEPLDVSHVTISRALKRAGVS